MPTPPVITDPNNTSVGDLCTEALKEAGWLGVGQVPVAEDITGAIARLQWMLQEWERKRWLVYALRTFVITSTGKQAYTIGPGGDFNIAGGFNPAFNQGFQVGQGPGVRPDKIESAFLRQLTQSQPNQIDYPLELLQSFEDYNTIALKQLKSFPDTVFYSPDWPMGLLYVYPVPQATIYGIGITVKVQLPSQFAGAADLISLPYEYYNAILYNLALRLRAKYQIPTLPTDVLPGLAKDSLNAVRGAYTAISRLSMPRELQRSGLYNIFSDQTY